MKFLFMYVFVKRKNVNDKMLIILKNYKIKYKFK